MGRGGEAPCIVRSLCLTEKIGRLGLAGVAPLVGGHPVHQRDEGSIGFDSLSGHTPRLRFLSLFGVCIGGNQLMFLSHIDVSLSLPLCNQ